MKKFLKKYKVYILSATFLAAIGCLFYFGIFLLLKEIGAKADDFQKKIIDNELNQKKIAKYTDKKKLYDQILENETKLTGILGNSEEIDFIRKIEKMAEETNNVIDLKIVDEGDKKENKSSGKNKSETKIKFANSEYITLQANVTGDYAGLVNFIRKIENFEYYANVILISAATEKEEIVTRPVLVDPFAKSGEEIPKVDPKMILKTQIDFIVYKQK